jgi:hypothetical protein
VGPLAAALALTLAASSPSVGVLPVANGEDVTRKEARGIDAILRQRLDAADFIEVLESIGEDDSAAFKCGRDPGCLSGLAETRGADMVATAILESAEEGFVLRLIVVEAGSERVLRDVREPVSGNAEDISNWIDRALRKAFAPDALAGGLVIRGDPEGARVLVDDAVAGTLPITEPIAGIVEGTHRLRVELEGYTTLERRFDVLYGEVTQLEVMLTPEDVGAREEAPPLDMVGVVLPISLASLGVGFVAGGAGFGVLSMFDAQEVERRAAAQLLVFPRDEEVIRRGEGFALVANVLYGVGGLLVLSGAGVAVAKAALAEPPPRESVVAPPVEGAPEADELRPGALE